MSIPGRTVWKGERERVDSGLAVHGINHRGQVEQRPAVAADPAARKLVAMLMQPSNATQIDHGTTLRGGGAHGASLHLSLR
jgi:hypothetical protein